MKARNIASLSIDCTKLCCNFVNTIYAWKGDDDYDYLVDYSAFIDWCEKLGVTEKRYLNDLQQKARQAPAQAALALRKIKNIRFLIFSLVSAVAGGDKKNYQRLLSDINPHLQEAKNNAFLAFEGSTFAVHFREPLHLVSPLWPVLDSLNSLLTEDELKRIKQCPTCGWVFYDTTKNGTRRWCNPLNCGTKDKMARYLKKLKKKK